MAHSAENRGRLEDALLLALFNTPTVEAAATAAGVSQRTAWRWLSRPEFASRVQEMKRHRLQSALDELQSASLDAVRCLRRNLDCGVPSVEVRAAATILDLGLRATELLDLEERLATMEALWGVTGDGRTA